MKRVVQKLSLCDTLSIFPIQAWNMEHLKPKCSLCSLVTAKNHTSFHDEVAMDEFKVEKAPGHESSLKPLDTTFSL
jgi:hypothetical protein